MKADTSEHLNTPVTRTEDVAWYEVLTTVCLTEEQPEANCETREQAKDTTAACVLLLEAWSEPCRWGRKLNG